MKKILCAFLAVLMALSAAACAGGDGGADSTTPTEFVRPSRDDFAFWVLTSEYERDTDKLRQYSYDQDGQLVSFDQHKAVTEENTLGGKTVKLTAYDADGKVSAFLSQFEYVYDAGGKLVQYRRIEAMTNKLADSYHFEYDADGRVVKQEKFYMEIPQETVEFTYDGARLTEAVFRSSVYESVYKYAYDADGVPAKLEYRTVYVKSGKEDSGTLGLEKIAEVKDSAYRITLRVTDDSDSVAAGKELVVYEELLNSANGIDAIRLEIKEPGFFLVGAMPMRQLGAMNATNWSGSSVTLIFKPLAAYRAEENK